MRRSSSTSSRCGASSAGCVGGPCDGCGEWHGHSFAFLAGAEDRLQHLVRIVAIDHRAQEARTVSTPAGSISASARLMRWSAGRRASGDQRLALRRGIEQALAAVVVAGLLHDIALVEQLLEHPAERLLGDAQDVEQVGDLQPGIAIDEVHDPVMGPAEAERLQLLVGIADEIAIGEEQQLDDIPAQIASSRSIGPSLARPSIRAWQSCLKIYVSHIDVSWVQCYKTISHDEILDRSRRLATFKSGRKEPAMAADGRELDYRAIVERHFGKHTGLPHSAKACPRRHAGDGNRPQQGW